MNLQLQLFLKLENIPGIPDVEESRFNSTHKFAITSYFSPDHPIYQE